MIFEKDESSLQNRHSPTVIDADMICVMHRGHIVESGTHMELMRLGGRYAALFRKQQAAAAVATTGTGD